MVLKKANFILGAVLLLVVGVSTTLGYVPDPQLWFDASDNPDHPEAWTNLGTAGGKLVASAKGVPVLEPHAGPDGGPRLYSQKGGAKLRKKCVGITPPRHHARATN